MIFNDIKSLLVFSILLLLLLKENMIFLNDNISFLLYYNYIILISIHLQNS